MNSIDIVLGIFLVIGLLRGLWRGLIVELASLLAIVLGVYGALHFSFYIAEYLQQQVEWSEKTMQTVAFILTLVGIMIAVMLLGKILTKILKIASLGLFNRLLGGIFGALKVCVIMGAMLTFLVRTEQIFQWLPKNTIETSILFNPVKSIGELVYANVMNFSEENFDIKEKEIIPNLDSIYPKTKDNLSNPSQSEEKTISTDTTQWNQEL